RNAARARISSVRELPLERPGDPGPPLPQDGRRLGRRARAVAVGSEPMSTPLLPTEFADLEPFATTWCLVTEPERWAQRLASTMDDLQAFYAACFPRVEAAIVYCDRFDLHDLPDDATRLLQLLSSFALVSYPIEVWRQTLPVNTGSAQMDRIAEP